MIVSSLPIVVHQMLPRLVCEFREQRPLVDVHIRAGYSSAVIDDVVGGLADFGIVSGELVSSTVERVDLRRESIYVVFPLGHPLSESSSPVRLAQLRDVSLISPPPESHTRLLIEGAAAAAGIHLRHAVLVPGFPELIEYVRAGVGVGYVPSGALPQPLPEDVGARLLSAPALSIKISLVRLVARHMSPAAEAFWGLVLKHLKLEHRVQTTRSPKARGARSRKTSRPRVVRRSPRSRITG